MKKIREFFIKHNKFIYITLNVMLIIVGFLLVANEASAGFTAEQLDKSTAICCFADFLVAYCFADIITMFFSKHKSDKE